MSFVDELRDGEHQTESDTSQLGWHLPSTTILNRPLIKILLKKKKYNYKMGIKLRKRIEKEKQRHKRKH